MPKRSDFHTEAEWLYHLRIWFAGQTTATVWLYSARLTALVSEAVLKNASDPAELVRITEKYELFDAAMNAGIVKESYRIADALLAALPPYPACR